MSKESEGGKRMTVHFVEKKNEVKNDKTNTGFKGKRWLTRRPLQRQLSEFRTKLVIVVGLSCTVVWIFLLFASLQSWKVWQAEPATVGVVFITALSAAFTVVPDRLELLLALTLGTHSEALSLKCNAMLRERQVVESSGSTSVLVLNKTGTLTTSEMVAKQVILMEDEHEAFKFQLCGSSYNPADGHVTSDLPVDEREGLVRLATACAASATGSAIRLVKESATFEPVGDSMHAALLVLAEKIAAKLGLSLLAQDTSNHTPFTNVIRAESAELKQIHFNANQGFGGVYATNRASGKTTLYMTGSPEKIVERCAKIICSSGHSKVLNASFKSSLRKEQTKMTEEGLRVIAIASVEEPPSDGTNISGATFHALIGLENPPRREVEVVIQQARQAHLAVVLLTGDHPQTARHVCQTTGLSSQPIVFAAQEFLSLLHPEKVDIVEKSLDPERSLVIARATPHSKYLVIKLLQELGHVVAFAGDALQDRQALRLADVSLVMGRFANRETKSASDLILLDDNLAGILYSVQHGRALVASLRSSVRFLLCLFFTHVGVLVGNAWLGLPTLLSWKHFLYLTMLTRLPSFALVWNPSEPGQMQREPEGPNTRLLGVWTAVSYALLSVGIGLASAFAPVILLVEPKDRPLLPRSISQVLVVDQQKYHHPVSWHDFVSDPDIATTARTISLSVLVVAQLLLALGAIGERCSIIFQIAPWRNPKLLVAVALSGMCHWIVLRINLLRNIFLLAPISPEHLPYVFAIASLVVPGEELIKLFRRLEPVLWTLVGFSRQTSRIKVD